MSRTHLAAALALLVAALALAPARAAAEQSPKPEDPGQPPLTAGPSAPAEAPAEPAEPPAADLAPPLRPLETTLTYERWQAMNPQQRLTFVDGAVLALRDFTLRLKESLANDARIPPETLKALVGFIDEYYPKLPSAEYLREMERIYLTEDGRNLTMMKCFQQAFRRMNRR